MREWVILHKKYILYGMVAFLGIGFIMTRFWQLDTLPLGMHLDEAGMAYDAWSLANYGVDRYLKSWPVYLINFGVGQSSLYAFLCAGLFRIFGYSIWLVRLPAAFFSLLTLVFGVKLAKQIYKDDLILPWVLGAMVTFCPYFIMNSRFGLDCNLMLGATTVFLYFMNTAMESGQIWRYVMSGFTGGIVLYTYALTYIIVPVFLLICFIYAIAIHKFSLKRWICMGIPMGILAFPLILVQIVNLFDLEERRLGPFTITRLPYYRASEIGHFQWDYFLSAWKHIFVGDSLLFDSIPGIWNLYAITVVLFIFGIISAFGRLWRAIIGRSFHALTVPFLWFLVVLLFESHMVNNTYRLNGIFYAVVLLAVEGINVLKRYIEKIYPLLLFGICGIYALCFMRFGWFYYSGRYTENTFPLAYFGVTFSEGIEFLEGNEQLSQKLTFVSERGIMYAVSSLISPYSFNITGDESIHWNNYWFGSLQEITDECNYLVIHNYDEYCEELRQAGFSEQCYDTYSLFYKEQ